MLDLAINHSEELRQKFRGIWFDDKYKFFENGTYYNDFTVDDTTWNRHQFVSLDSDGDVIGYIGYDINRQANYAHSLAIINFTNDVKTVFAKDLLQVLKDIFEKFAFNKLSFMVVVGNPIESSYDKIVLQHGGRIVGIHKQDTKLMDGKLYDIKQYEILRENYFERNNRPTNDNVCESR